MIYSNSLQWPREKESEYMFFGMKASFWPKVDYPTYEFSRSLRSLRNEAQIYGLKRLLAEAIDKSQAKKTQTSVCVFFK